MAATTGRASSAAISGAAKTESVERPTAGFAAASASPRAAATPTRKPVKLPGPMVTAMRSSAANSMAARSITRATSGISASAWPRSIGSDSRATTLRRSLSYTAAEQAASAVSMARTRMT